MPDEHEASLIAGSDAEQSARESRRRFRELRWIYDMRKAIFVTLLLVVAGGVPSALGQDATINSNTVRDAILATPIWHVDRSTGATFWHFEMRGDKLWGQSVNNDGRSLPAVQVEVTNNGLTWMSPDGQKITLRYDPQDIQFPFKGTDSQGATFEFTPQ